MVVQILERLLTTIPKLLLDSRRREDHNEYIYVKVVVQDNCDRDGSGDNSQSGCGGADCCVSSLLARGPNVKLKTAVGCSVPY